jgi:hypothetical protein
MKKASDQLLRLERRSKFYASERGGHFVSYQNWKLPSKLDKYSAKLTAKYLGPARLQHVFSPRVVFLMDEKGEALDKFHIGDLTAPSPKYYSNVMLGLVSIRKIKFLLTRVKNKNVSLLLFTDTKAKAYPTVRPL